MHPIKFIADRLYKQAIWIYNHLDVRRLLVLSMVMVYVGLGFLLYFPFSAEPLAIFLMSVLALVFGGVGTIASIMAIIKDTDEIKEEIEDAKTADKAGVVGKVQIECGPESTPRKRGRRPPRRA